MGCATLLVQVSPAVRFAVRQALQDSPYELGPPARTLAEGMHYYEMDRSALVVMDMSLSPHEAIQDVRRFHKRFPMSRILIIYSHNSRPSLGEARRVGAAETLLFPFEDESLRGVLARLAARKSPGSSTGELPAIT